MHGMLKITRTHIAGRKQSLTVPLSEAERSITESRDLIKNLMAKNKVLLDDLDQLGEAALLASFARTSSDELLETLRKEIIPIINTADVTKESERDKIQQATKRVRDEWLQRPGEGFMDTSTRAWGDYQRQSIILLHDRISEAAKDASITFPLIMRDDTSPNFSATGLTMQDAFDLVKTAWQISIGVTGAGAGIGVAAGSSTIAIGGTVVALGPLGLFLVAAGAAGIVWAMFRRRSEMRKLRRQLIEFLPTYSDTVIARLRTQARESLERYKGSIVNVVGQLISIQQDRIAELENSVKMGDLKSRQDRIEFLQNLEEECKKAEQRIQDFYSIIVPITEA